MNNTKIIFLITSILIICSCANLNRPKVISSNKKCEKLPLTVKWKAPVKNIDENNIKRNVTGYRVFIKETKKKHFEEFITVEGKTELVFKDSRLKPNMPYEIRIVAFNEAGEGAPSKVFHIRTCDNKGK